MNNRFDTSQQNPYVSNYTPLPFQEIMALGEKTNQNFQAGKQAEADLGALGQAIKAAPMYEQDRQRFIGMYNNKTKELVDKYQGNYGDPNFKMDVQKLTNDFKSQPEINAFGNTLKSYNDWEGQKKDPNNAMNLDFTYDMDPNDPKNFRQRSVTQEGVYSPSFTKFEDYNEAAKKVMGKIAEDGQSNEQGLDFSRSHKLNNGETEVYSNKEHGYVKVSKDKLEQLSNLMVEEYANTVAGKHHLQSKTGTNITYNQLDPETKQLANQEFAQHLFNANASQIGGKTTNKVSYLQTTNRQAAADNDANNFGRLVTTNEQGNPEVVDIESVFAGLGLGKVFDKTGALATNSPLASEYTVTKSNGEVKVFDNSIDAHKFAGNWGSISQQRVGSNKSAETVVNEAYAKLVPVAQKLGIVPKDKDGKLTGKYAEALYNYGLAIAKDRSTTSKLQQSTSTGMTKAMFGENSDLSNMEFYTQGNEDSNAKITNEEVGKLAKNSRVTGIDYFGNNQAGWKVASTPKDDKGNPTGVDNALIAIPRDQSFNVETKPVWTISKGAIEFAKTGEINDAYVDKQASTFLQDKLKTLLPTQGYKTIPQITSSSTEQDKEGNLIVRGSYVDNSTGTPKLQGVEYNSSTGQVELLSLYEIQNRKTQSLEVKGSLKQYNSKLGETVKNSNIP